MFLLVHAALAASLTQSSQTDFSAGSHDNTTSSATAGDVLVERVVTDSGEWLDQGNDHVALQKDDNTWFDTAGCPSNFFSGSTATYNGTPFIGGPATVSGRVAGMRSGVAVDPPSGENYVDEVHYLHPGGRCSVQYHTLTWTYSDGTTSSSTYKNYHDCGSYNASGSDFAITHLGSYGSYGCCSHWYEAAFTNPSPSKLVDSVSMTYNDGCGGSYLGQMWAVTMVLDGDDYDAWSGGGTEGVFTSSVLDAGDPSAEWTAVSWSSTLGTGDSLTVAVRSGSTSSPDGSWSGWGSENTAAASLSSSGRYLQYRVSFTASTSAAALHDITLSYELDTDGDGSLTDVDCDDTDDTVAPGATELCDGQLNDCDSSIGADEADDDNDGWVECAIDGGGWDGSTISGGEDCDDGDSSVFPGATELCDGLLNDCEGSIGADEADDDNDGWVECAVDSGGWDGSTISGGEDCDDGDSSIFPGANELCDGVLNDCEGSIGADEADDDNDGYVECAVDSGGWDGSTISGGEDCDDSDATVFPGATELCDGLLNDCEGSIGADEADDDSDGWVECTIDADGWDGATISGGEDCDDGDDSVFPGATELCDGVLNDCEGSMGADEGDDDGDGWVECVIDGGGWDGDTISGGEDCDDDEASVYPGAKEVPYDGIDQDCDSADLCDVDEDSYDDLSCGGDDCDDQDASINVAASEAWYDGIDQDCDEGSDYDADGDGFDSASYGGDDCDDARAETWPGAPDEPYDGVVTDCNSADEFDADGDGHDSAEHGGTDCDDANSAIGPRAEELWYDGIDQDCDGNDDDKDGDGFALEADCDDQDGSVYPGAPGWGSDCEALDSDVSTDSGTFGGGGGCFKSSTVPGGAGLLAGLLGLLLLRRR